MNNFAVLDIAYTHYDAGAYICVKTNHACHLSLYHTIYPPGRHKTSRIERGLAVPWGAYFCFVAWEEIEQSDAGDTIYHRFNVLPWMVLTTKWFAFRGTIGGVLSPSVSCIFEHQHPGGLPMSVVLYPDSPGDLCEINTGVPNACPNHYLNINEVVPDEDTSYIEQWLPVFTSVKTDLYNLGTGTLGKIESITLHSRAKRIWGAINTTLVSLTIKTHGSIRYYSTGPLPLAWVDRYRNLPLNPITGLPWTQTDINDLQAGVTLSWYTGGAWLSKARVTQFNLIVVRGINCPDDPS